MAGAENEASPRARSGQGDEEELATKTLQIQSKRFYLDVKQNKRGRFIKMAEVGAGGRKSRLLMSMPTAALVRDHLTDFGEFCSQLEPVQSNPEKPLPDGGVLKSQVISRDNRRYYLDLKENQRGRFLRVSQTVPRGGPRSQVAIPSQGLVEMRDALTDLLDEFGSAEEQEPEASSGGGGGLASTSRSLRADNKTFYFDIGHNNRGTYMRLSEVRRNFRMSITLPDHAWKQFRDALNECIAENETPEAVVQSSSGSPTEGAGDGSKASNASPEQKEEQQ